MRNKKISVRQAILLGQLFVNGGIIIVMLGTWILSFVVVVQAKLSVWFILAGIFAGPIVAWPWWSFSKPIWEHWAVKRIDELEIEAFYREAVRAQLAWPRGHVFEKTELKSSEHKLHDLKFAVHTMEEYLNGKTTNYIDEHKASYPGYDTGIIDETKGFIFNLNAAVSTVDDISNASEITARLDELLNRINKTVSSLNAFHWTEYSEWHFIAQEDLNRIRTALRRLRK